MHVFFVYFDDEFSIDKIISMSQSHSLLPFQNRVPVYDLYLPSHGVPVTKGGQSGLQVCMMYSVPVNCRKACTIHMQATLDIMTYMYMY